MLDVLKHVKCSAEQDVPSAWRDTHGCGNRAPECQRNHVLWGSWMWEPLPLWVAEARS